MVVLVLAGVVYSIGIGIERQPWLVLVAVADACYCYELFLLVAVGGRSVVRWVGQAGVRGKRWKAKVD